MDTHPLNLYRAQHVRELDRIAIEDKGLTGICLMERAGSAAFKILQAHWLKARSIIVFCGTGNNAGDGYVLARLAYLAGYNVQVLQLGEIAHISGDARLAFDSMTSQGLVAEALGAVKVNRADVAIDALFGTGLARNVVGVWAKAIEMINRLPCLALDIPSGLKADTGNVLGVAVHATVTVTFIGLKQGLFTGEGPEYCGQLYFDDLHVPPDIYNTIQTPITRIEAQILKTALPKRSRTAHKGQFGHVLVIGGDKGMSGAVYMAAEAAARVGAGLVSVATRSEQATYLTRPELMVHGVDTVEQLKPLLTQATVIAIGPGLGQSDWARAMFKAIKKLEKPIIIDADALNLLAQMPCRFYNSILTPHPGEASRLLQLSTTEIQADRFAAVAALQERFSGVCVLKGAGTLVINPQKQISVCTLGNPGMASGGMGDVLTGVIAGLCAQGLSVFEAAKVGVYLHAKAADRAALDGERGLLAHDLMPWLRYYSNPT